MTEPGHPRLPRSLWAVILVMLAAGVMTLALSVTDAMYSRSQDRSDQADANRQTCLSVANAQWRNAISTVIIAGIDRDREALADGRARLEQSLVDGERVGDADSPLCPYVPGNPDLTPSRPVAATTTTTTEPE